MKPPKSWFKSSDPNQHHGNNNEKNNHYGSTTTTTKSKFGTNMDNTFRNYMTTKIDRQRNQFGLLLPPDPNIDQEKQRNDNVAKDEEDEEGEMIKTKHATIIRRNELTKIENASSKIDRKSNDSKKCITNQNNSNRSIKNDDGDDNNFGMVGVLNRLKRKHGNRHRRRCGNSSSNSSSNNKIEKKLAVKSQNGTQQSQKFEHVCINNNSSISMQSLSQTKTTKTSKKIEMNKNGILLTSSSYKSLSKSDEEDKDENDINSLVQNISQPLSHCSSENTKEITNAISLKKQRPDLFLYGVVVLVNGYTNPSSDTIMRMLHKHGGNLERYETSKVTHIIAENLSVAKANIYKRQKKPIPVVKPKWITDCVSTGTLLPHQDYLIDEVIGKGVASMKQYFSKPGRDGFSTSEKENLDKKEIPREAKNLNKSNFDCIRDSVQCDGHGDSIQTVHEKMIDSRPSVNGNHEDNITLLDNALAVDQRNMDGDKFEKELFPSQNVIFSHDDASPPGNCNRSNNNRGITNQNYEVIHKSGLDELNAEKYIDNDISKVPSSFQDIFKAPETNPSPTKPKSFVGPRNVGNDPNFLESYFSSSRLSFIGSFKQRIENDQLGKSNVKRCSREGSHCYVFHVDMDYFFAAIAVRNYPQYKDKPVAVGHAWKNDVRGVQSHQSNAQKLDNGKNSTSELSTCNYIARKFGVGKGMFLQHARQLCPELVVLPYDYDGYEDASRKVGEILNQFADTYSGIIEQVSCDESYLQLNLGDDEVVNIDDMGMCKISEAVLAIGNKIKRNIFEATECTASIGIGSNKLLAKLATDKAKLKGGDAILFVEDWKVFLAQVKLRDLPGVGYRLEKKLNTHNLVHVADVWEMVNESELCEILGQALGSKIFKFCHGKDSRPVQAAQRKTIGAECNYGVRFNGPYGVEHMMAELAKEVVKRMSAIGVFGRHITLKVKERQVNAPAPGKYNGHGKCNDHSKSCNLPVDSATRDKELLCREGLRLFAEIGLDKDEVRGMGIIISKLEFEGVTKASSLEPWLQRRSLSKEDNVNQREDKNSKKSMHNLKTLDEHANPQRNEMVDLSSDSEMNSPTFNKLETPLDWQDDKSKEVCIDSFGEDHSDNIVLPPLEEISMSDVMALPLDLREKILSEIQRDKSSRSSHSNDFFENNDGDSPRRKRKKITKVMQTRRKAMKRESGQIDMKRMMKLAMVKSGHDSVRYDGGQVSLTQLGHLPLDVQLQVVNNDDIVMKKSKPNSSKLFSGSIRQMNFSSPTDFLEESIETVNENEQKKYPVEYNLMSSDEEVEEQKEDDIKYLCNWLDGHKDPDAEEMNMLEQFICVCIDEMRLDDAIKFLRVVKRKSRSWTSNNYVLLIKACDKFLMKTQGRRLDWKWLGL